MDTHSIGSAVLDGQRSGADFRWSAQVATDQVLGGYGAARIASRAWLLEPRRPWRPVEPADVATLTVDREALGAALSPAQRVAAEDRGLEYVEGARARHCRIAVDGPTFQAAFPEIAWLAGLDADLHRWRGQLDYWVFVDG